MSKSQTLFAIFLLFFFFAACKKEIKAQQDTQSISTGLVTEIRVKVLNTKISGHELFKTISTPTEIDSLVNFTNENALARSNLKSNIDKIFNVQDRSTQVDISFYQSDEYLGTLGLGFYDHNKCFIKYRQSGKSRVAVISSQQKKELLDLIGLSEERFNSLLTN
ncbi:MAG: hypothetical protein SF097_26945 [Acidobacteriota bacterium]|nr:hypothetical protein [Acidobacteriota bacterium]